VFESEYRIQRKDGGWIWLYEKASCRYEKNGKRYIDGIAADITERNQALQALEETEEKYRFFGCAYSGHHLVGSRGSSGGFC
jgi:hypothetical protein